MFDDIVAWPNLCDAWERVADNRGAPGPDHVSIRRFRRNWEENLRTLQRLARENRYRSGRLRRVAIPKRGGGQRLLRIANVGDRVLQRAALNVLDDHFERIFYTCSYGYRPRRSLHDAVAAILRFRDQGQVWLLDADIDDCFDSIDQALLQNFLADDLVDARVLTLLDKWLHAGVCRRGPDRGIAQGMPISPLLCNIYLHRLDAALVRRRWAMVRYADDFVVCCRSQMQAEQVRDLAADVLDDLKLQLEPSKTRVASFEEGFDYLGVHFERDSYSFLWEEKRFVVEGRTPRWLWGYVPRGYS